VGDGRIGDADHALAVRKSLASKEAATLTIVHVVEKIATSGDAALGWYANEELVEAKADKIGIGALQGGVAYEREDVTHVGPQPAHEIAELRSRDRSGPDRRGNARSRCDSREILLGSVTQRLLHFAPCPY